jgi:sulfur-oxidizing protein SoxY
MEALKTGGRRFLFKALGAAGYAFGARSSGLRVLAALGLYGGAKAQAQNTQSVPSASKSARPLAQRTPAFKAETPNEALRQILGSATLVEVGEQQIELQIPELAENGAMVPVSVTSKIPDTQQIMLLIDKNPYPLAASFYFPEGTEPSVQTRVKMAESSRVRVLVQTARGQERRYYTIVKETRVTLGGCGA